MENIRIGIVEDELLIAHNIASALKKLGYEVLPIAPSYNEGIKMLSDFNPDIVLLDIQLGGDKDGIDLAHLIRKEHQLPFIFITANSDAATIKQAKLSSPSAYLIKPFTKEDLFATIEIALHNFSTNRPAFISESHNDISENMFTGNMFLIKEGNRFHKIPFNEILYLQSDNVYITVYTRSQKYLIRGTLQEQESRLENQNFVRIHRSYIVNLEHVKSMETEFIHLGKEKIPIGKTYRESVLNRFII